MLSAELHSKGIEKTCLYSSVVEQSLDKAWVEGSNPSGGTTNFSPLV